MAGSGGAQAWRGSQLQKVQLLLHGVVSGVSDGAGAAQCFQCIPLRRHCVPLEHGELVRLRRWFVTIRSPRAVAAEERVTRRRRRYRLQQPRRRFSRPSAGDPARSIA